jgi:hypothetical protein
METTRLDGLRRVLSRPSPSPLTQDLRACVLSGGKAFYWLLVHAYGTVSTNHFSAYISNNGENPANSCGHGAYPAMDIPNGGKG